MNQSSDPPAAPTVLCIDDEPAVLRALRRELQRQGWRVMVAPDGPTGLTLLERESIDVLICDHAMPGMCGTEVLQRAREIAPDVKRILLSAHADQPLVTMPAVNTGHVYRLLLKPWSHDELCQALTDALGQDPRAWSDRQARIRDRLHVGAAPATTDTTATDPEGRLAE